MPTSRAHLRRTRQLLWVLLIAAAAVSTAGNITRALESAAPTEATGPLIAAAVPPLALLALTHLTGMWSRIAVRGWVYWCFLAAIAAVTAAAFRLSFDALRTLAVRYGYGHGDAALFPLILDGLMAVCTLGLVVLARITDDDSSGSTGPGEAGEAAGDAAVTSRDAAGDAAGDAPGTTTAALPRGTDAVMRPAELPASRRGDAPGNGDAAGAAERLAVQLVVEGRTTLPVDAVQQVLLRTTAGQPSRAVAAAVGASASSVQRIIKASRDMAAAGAASNRGT